jgi:hypothetical protein
MSRYAILWLLWLGVLIGGFAVIEGMALESGTPSTLSDFVVWLSHVWGPFPFVLGIVVGGLGVHFWWHWRPDKADRGK